MIRDNAALIGGLGVAIGAIIAASLPDTRAEAAVIGKASDSVKRAAGKAAQSGFETAKETVLSAADAAAKSVSDADLGKHASRMTEDMSDKLKEAADDIVTAAFNPARTEEKSVMSDFDLHTRKILLTEPQRPDLLAKPEGPGRPKRGRR